MNEASYLRPEAESAARVDPSTWTWAIARTVIALWLPFVLAALFDDRVRRRFEDLWFWPGLFPAAKVFDDLYTPRAALFVALQLVVWSAVGRRWRWLSFAAALLLGFLSMGHLLLLLSL